MIEWFYGASLGTILVALLVFLPFCVQAGYWLSSYFHGKGKIQVGETIPASILGVHALLIGFTFSMSLARYEERRHLVVEEANAIGTTYLRAKTLESPFSLQAQDLLFEYTKAKVQFGQLVHLDENIPKVTASILDTQSRLWSSAQDMTRKYRGPIESIYLDSLNSVIDLHAERMAAIHNQLPPTVIALLLVSLVISMLSFGFVEGLNSRRSSFFLALLSVLFSVVLTLIVDLDRPRRGFIKVSQSPINELYEQMVQERSVK